MERKNPENKMLDIVWRKDPPVGGDLRIAEILAQLAVAEANLVKAGKSSALPHFIAIVKEIERILGFEFKVVKDGAS